MATNYDFAGVFDEALDRIEKRGGVRFTTTDGMVHEVRAYMMRPLLDEKPMLTVESLRLLAQIDEVLL